MAATIQHVFTSPIADGTNTQLVRPSNWNSGHLVTMNAVGSEISGAFSNGGGVTFGLETNGFITASAPAGGAGDGFNILAAGTQTAGTAATVNFANSNGITFGMSNSSQITASHNGLTTAAQSNHSHGNPTLALTNINGTTASASNGLTLSLSAVVPAQTVQPVAYSAANGSANFSTLTFANSNGVSFSTGTQGLYATVATNYQSQGAYLTTAAQSNHSHGNPTLALTNLTGTTASNSAGFTLSLSANAPGAAAENNWFNLLGANTAGNTTASGSTIGLSGLGVTLSGTNGSVIVVSGGGGGGFGQRWHQLEDFRNNL